MIAFSKIKAGETLYNCHKTRMVNTTMRKMGTWLVKVIEVYPEKQTALVSWNGNRPEVWGLSRMQRLRRSPAKSLPTSWTISKEDWDAAILMPPIFPEFYKRAIAAEREYLEEGVRRALGLWVSELEPELMFRMGQTRPFGVTAKGHGTPYIEIKWDENFYPTGESISYSGNVL